MLMHDGELTLTREAISAMIASRLPEYSHLPLSEKDYGGTVNHVYRLGSDLYLRLPRMPHSEELRHEARWLSCIQPHVAVALPQPVRLLDSTDEYPCVWGVFEWIHGETLMHRPAEDETALAEALSGFVNQLHALPVPDDAPFAGRLPLRQLDRKTMDALGACRGMFDDESLIDRAARVWKAALNAAAWNGERCLIHADLLKTNLMFESGRLSVLDFGSFGAGDPAFDLIPAWAVFGPEGRAAFRAKFDADIDTWQRARAYALHQALLIIPYYASTYPEFTEMAKNTVRQVVIDAESDI